MSQVPVKWVSVPCLLDKQPTTPISKRPDNKFVPVVPLSELREVVEGLNKQYRGEACYIYKEALNDILASLGEQ